jgi:hypothetical protein
MEKYCFKIYENEKKSENVGCPEKNTGNEK